MHLKEIGIENMEWMCLVYNRIRCRESGNEILLSIKEGETS
jgi:hypothetical protein